MFLSIGYFSFSSITHLNGNARVINYAGIVRGATQKLIKNELFGVHNDNAIEDLDSILSDLQTGNGQNELTVLQDDNYLYLLNQVRLSWNELKNDIYNNRAGANPEILFNASEEYFFLVNEMVAAAEIYSQKNVNISRKILLIINIVLFIFLFAALVYYLRADTLKKRTEILGELAFTDSLTKISNRTHFDSKVKDLDSIPPENDIGVLMFDMNNLKIVNDELGHQSGDQLLTEFSQIIKDQAPKGYTVYRFGGDEFVVLFDHANKNGVENYLKNVNKKAYEYNQKCEHEIKFLSFASGYTIGNLKHNSMRQLIFEADRLMYINKRKMKENNLV